MSADPTASTTSVGVGGAGTAASTGAPASACPSWRAGSSTGSSARASTGGPASACLAGAVGRGLEASAGVPATACPACRKGSTADAGAGVGAQSTCKLSAGARTRLLERVSWSWMACGTVRGAPTMGLSTAAAVVVLPGLVQVLPGLGGVGRSVVVASRVLHGGDAAARRGYTGLLEPRLAMRRERLVMLGLRRPIPARGGACPSGGTAGSDAGAGGITCPGACRSSGGVASTWSSSG